MLQAAKLAANARPFRYLCYPAIALGFLLFDRPAFQPAAAVLSWCLLWPLCVDLLQRKASAKAILRVHLLEALLACGIFAWAGVNAELVFAVVIVIVASNALQGGIRQALRAAAGTALGVVVGSLTSSMHSVASLSGAAAFSGCLVLVYCALLGHKAHAQALALSSKRAQVRVMNARLQQYLPHTLAERLLEPNKPRLERRWLVVAFVDLAGFTSLVEQLQAEELVSVLDSYLGTVASITERCGGTLSKVLGDGAMLVFGESGPVNRRRFVADALLCCRLLRTELADLAERWRAEGTPAPVRLKVGMASGFCSLGDWGGGGRLEYTVIGHPVNLASRLESLAGADEVLVCERTAMLAEVTLSPVQERAVKGLGPVCYRKVEPY